MRRMHLVAAAVVLALGALGCGKPTEGPDAVVKAAAEASQRGDVDELERLLGEAMFAEMLAATGNDREQLRQRLLDSAEQVRVKSYEVMNTSIEGDTATVDTEAVATITAMGQEIRARGRTHLRKVSGRWRLWGAEALGEPEVIGSPAGPAPPGPE